MDWREYEQVTRKVYEAIGAQTGVKIVGYGNSFKVKGCSGVEYQIDVLTSHFDGIHQYLTDIECKYWNQKVDNDILTKVKATVEDCNFSKGVVVSTIGFTPAALAYAKFNNIGLVILREPTDDDLKGRIQTIVLSYHPHYAEITKLDHAASEIYHKRDGPILADGYHYELPDGSRIELSSLVQQFQDKLTFDKVDQDIEEQTNFPKGTQLVDSDGVCIAKVVAVKIGGRLKAGETHTIRIDGKDKVWLIMKAIFEDKTFIVSHEGQVRDISS